MNITLYEQQLFDVRDGVLKACNVLVSDKLFMAKLEMLSLFVPEPRDMISTLINKFTSEHDNIKVELLRKFYEEFTNKYYLNN